MEIRFASWLVYKISDLCEVALGSFASVDLFNFSFLWHSEGEIVLNYTSVQAVYLWDGVCFLLLQAVLVSSSPASSGSIDDYELERLFYFCAIKQFQFQSFALS